MRPRTASAPLAAFGLTALLGVSSGCSYNPVAHAFGGIVEPDDDTYRERARATPRASAISGTVRQTSSFVNVGSDGLEDWYEFWVQEGERMYFCRCEHAALPAAISPGVTVNLPARTIDEKHGIPVYDGCNVTPSAPSSVPSSR